MVYNITKVSLVKNSHRFIKIFLESRYCLFDQEKTDEISLIVLANNYFFRITT